MPLASARNETENSASHLELVRLGPVVLPATTAIVAEARTTPANPFIDPEIPIEKESAKTSSSERAVFQTTGFETGPLEFVSPPGTGNHACLGKVRYLRIPRCAA